jgi:TatD DNase family protein
MIDFHCHLDLYPDPHTVARECVSREIYVLSVTNTPSAWQGTVKLAPPGSRIRTALGLHPQLAQERKTELPLFAQLLSQTRYVGEVGLDGSPEYKQHWLDQVTVFTSILEACERNGGRILSIHSRRAAAQVLDALEAHRGAGIPVMHWFSGSVAELRRATDLGCWFSVGPAMLAGTKGKKLVENIPRDRILTESDGPFAQIEGRAVLPWQNELTVGVLASIWGESTHDVEHSLIANLRRLVRSLPAFIAAKTDDRSIPRDHGELKQ